MTEKKETDYPPFPNVFFEDEELFTPIQLRKYGYRIKREPRLALIPVTPGKDGRAC